MVLAIVTYQAALNSGRLVRFEQIATRVPREVDAHRLRRILDDLVADGHLFVQGSGWRLRAVPIGPDPTRAYAASARLGRS